MSFEEPISKANKEPISKLLSGPSMFVSVHMGYWLDLSGFVLDFLLPGEGGVKTGRVLDKTIMQTGCKHQAGWHG